MPPYPPGYPPPRPRTSRVLLIVGIVLAAVVVVCGAGIGTLYVIGSRLAAVSGGTEPPAGSARAPSAAATRSATTPTLPVNVASGVVLYSNTLRGPQAGMPDDRHCFPGDDGYHVASRYSCYLPIGAQATVDVTVTVELISGSTTSPYGLSIRRALDDSGWYDFGVDGDGKWAVFKCRAKTCTPLIGYTPNAAILRGLDATNMIEVRAEGAHFQFFANGVQLGQLDDSSYASGVIGLANATDGECVFTYVDVLRPGE